MERRKEPRYQVDAHAEVICGDDRFDATVTEISKHGIRLKSADFVEPGRKVKMVVFLGSPERVSGEVMWVLAEPKEGTVTYRMGIYCESGGVITGERESA